MNQIVLKQSDNILICKVTVKSPIFKNSSQLFSLFVTDLNSNMQAYVISSRFRYLLRNTKSQELIYLTVSDTKLINVNLMMFLSRWKRHYVVL